MQIELSHGFLLLIDASDFSILKGWDIYPVRKRNGVYAQACKWDSQNKKQVKRMVHRMLMGMPVGSLVMHKDGNGLNCHRHNMMLGDHHKNGAGFRTKRKGSASKFRGVHINRGRGKRWTAMFWDNGKTVYLGRFATQSEAAKAYDVEAKNRYGDYAHLNFP